MPTAQSNVPPYKRSSTAQLLLTVRDGKGHVGALRWRHALMDLPQIRLAKVDAHVATCNEVEKQPRERA